MKKKILARFTSVCAETGMGIRKGDEMIYDYSAKKCYSKNSQEFKNFDQPEKNIDPAAGMVQANEEIPFENFWNLNYN